MLARLIKSPFVLPMALGIFVGNLFFHGSQGDWTKGFFVGLIAVVLFIILSLISFLFVRQ